MTILHYDYFVLAILSELQKNQPNFTCNNFNKNIFYSSPFIFLQKHSQTTLNTKIIKDKKSKQTAQLKKLQELNQ